MMVNKCQKFSFYIFHQPKKKFRIFCGTTKAGVPADLDPSQNGPLCPNPLANMISCDFSGGTIIRKDKEKFSLMENRL
jgi:hypothetical protein